MSVSSRASRAHGLGLLLLACCCLTGIASGGQTLRIGVFHQRATGGQGAAVDGLVRGLERLGYATERIADLDALTLAECDVVYLSDMHAPGNVHEDWRKNLDAFVRDWLTPSVGDALRGVPPSRGFRSGTGAVP